MISRVLHGDCLDVLPTLDADSLAACVTDPPYGLAFMGKDWDHGVPGERFWHEVLRVLTPGAHLLAFGGTRTYHRLACAIEDAGFEIRDCLMWLYGSGFPKSLDVSKAIDKAAGAERDVIGPDPAAARRNKATSKFSGCYGTIDDVESCPITAPATHFARQWAGWGTALKPAWESIILARKPLVGTVAANVTRYGTGAINVDACRIAYEVGGNAASNPVVRVRRNCRTFVGREMFGGSIGGEKHIDPHTLGRWPANVLLDEDAAAALDVASAPSVSRMGKPRASATPGQGWGMTATGAEYNDFGGASRFFYTSKADRAEREAGLDTFDAVRRSDGRAKDIQNPRLRTTARRNHHPTVKPLDLIRWLVRLVTPPDGIVLDPFCGSGTTLLAARAEGRSAIGIEREAAYVEIARGRLDGTAPLFAEAQP